MLMDTVGRKCCCWKTPDALRAVFRCFVFRAQHTDGDCIRLCFDAGRFISNDAAPPHRENCWDYDTRWVPRVVLNLFRVKFILG